MVIPCSCRAIPAFGKSLSVIILSIISFWYTRVSTKVGVRLHLYFIISPSLELGKVDASRIRLKWTDFHGAKINLLAIKE